MNIQEIAVTDALTGETTNHIIIDRGNGEFTSMTKAHWDELQAKQTEGGLI